MRINGLYRFIQLITIVFVSLSGAAADSFPLAEAAKLLPAEVGTFKALGSVRAFEDRSGTLSYVSSAAQRNYRSTKGETFLVTLVATKSDSSAFAGFMQLSKSLANAQSAAAPSGGVGTRSLLLPNEELFYKGKSYVMVRSMGRAARNEALLELARELANGLENGEGDVPVLVKHLPDLQSGDSLISYAVDLERLKAGVPNQPVFDALSFEGGTEAAAASYGPAQLVLIEYTTPQLATENDQRLQEKILQLKGAGQSVPTAYRRVGNYSVFVFNAPSEQSANQLIDQVKYEQVVQWLGDNPNWLKQAQKEYTETTLGVFVTVVKTSGVAAAVCFGIGGFFGALLFARRRAQQVKAEAYSDAGGMMRLNLDEMTAHTNPRKLIGPGMSDKP